MTGVDLVGFLVPVVLAADDRVVLVDATVQVQVPDAERATYAVEDYRRALERVRSWRCATTAAR